MKKSLLIIALSIAIVSCNKTAEVKEVKTAFAANSVPLSYKVKLSHSGSDNEVYSAEELGRNDNFKMTKGATDLGTDPSAA